MITQEPGRLQKRRLSAKSESGSPQRASRGGNKLASVDLAAPPPSTLLELQRTAGNQSVSALISQIRTGEVVQRAGPGQAVANRPAPAAKVLSPIDQNHAAYQATFQRWWSSQSLDERARWFVVLTALMAKKSNWASGSMLFVKEIYGNSGVTRSRENAADFLQFFPTFVTAFVRDTAPKEVERDLLADPARAVAIWSDLLRRFPDHIELTPSLKEFSERLENSVFRAYASEGLEGKGGKPPSKDKVTATEALVRQMIVDDTQDYKIAGLAGVDQWAMPYTQPETLVDWLAGGSAGAGATGSIIGIWALEDGILVAAGASGIGLLAVGAALGIAAAFKSASDKEAAERQRVAEAGVKRAIIDGFLEIATMLRRNEDVLALRLIGDAKKEGQKISLEHRANLEPWVWKKLFGSFPRDDRAGAQTVTNKIDEFLRFRKGQ